MTIHIIDDWFLTPDTYSWMIARKAGESKIQGSDRTYPTWQNQIYMDTPENVLKAWTRDYIRMRALENDMKGELKDFMIFLSSEYKRLAEHVDRALEQAKAQEVAR